MTDMNKIADKIQKCFALANNNPSEGEAKQALLMAQKLIAKYNVDMSQLEGNKQDLKCSLEVSKVKPSPRDNPLGMVLADSFACKCIIVDRKIGFFGREDNAQAAKSAMEFIHKTLEAGIRRVCRAQGLESSERGASAIYNAYALGFNRGLKEALDAQTTALAIVVPEDVKDAFNKKFPHTTSYRGSGMQFDSRNIKAYTEGKTDGHSAMDRRSLASGN